MKAALLLLRLIFVITTASVGYQIAIAMFGYPPFSIFNIISIILAALIAVLIIWVEIHYATKFIVGIFTVILGLLIGFIASHLFLQAIFLLPHIRAIKQTFPIRQIKQLDDAVNVGVTFFFCYMAVAILFRTRNRYKLLIPFVEMAREVENRNLILDSSVIIDGRIASICDTNVLKGKLVIPKFVLNELQTLADSSDKKKRGRGRRGIEILGELQKKTSLHIEFDPQLFSGIKDVDDKLIRLAQELSGCLVTNDYNLKKIAELQQIEVVNLHSLANALRPPVLPSDMISIQVIKPGEEPDQGIGYLEDGTVVIVENSRRYIGKTVMVVVTNVFTNQYGEDGLWQTQT